MLDRCESDNGAHVCERSSLLDHTAVEGRVIVVVASWPSFDGLVELSSCTASFIGIPTSVCRKIGASSVMRCAKGGASDGDCAERPECVEAGRERDDDDIAPDTIVVDRSPANPTICGAKLGKRDRPVCRFLSSIDKFLADPKSRWSIDDGGISSETPGSESSSASGP